MPNFKISYKPQNFSVIFFILNVFIKNIFDIFMFINFPIEEPLHPSFIEQKDVWNGWHPKSFDNFTVFAKPSKSIYRKELPVNIPYLNPSKKGIIFVGPWRGANKNLKEFRNTVKEFQFFTGWPVYADPLSGLQDDQPGLIEFWELLISAEAIKEDQDLQILRLGPMPSSRKLESFFYNYPNNHVLITEGEKRLLDPLHIAVQYSEGFRSWFIHFTMKYQVSDIKFRELNNKLVADLKTKSEIVCDFLNRKFKYQDKINELSIYLYLLNILPRDIPLMLSASSPVRDFLTYSGSLGFTRRCFSFRGASGIDGNLSLAIGLSIVLGPMILICGDLSFLYDSNSFLLKQQLNNPLIIILLDNNGGGIFKQLNLDKFYKSNFDKLFGMPQSIDSIKLASIYNIPSKDIACYEELEKAIKWGMNLTGPILLRVATNPEKDNLLRKDIVDSLKKQFN